MVSVVTGWGTVGGWNLDPASGGGGRGGSGVASHREEAGINCACVLDRNPKDGTLLPVSCCCCLEPAAAHQTGDQLGFSSNGGMSPSLADCTDGGRGVVCVVCCVYGASCCRGLLCRYV